MAALLPAGCGDTGTTPTPGWTPGVFEPSERFANQCASPRTGVDPTTNRPYPDVAGSVLAENNFLRSWTNDLYLWYREVPDVDPAAYSTSDYFALLKTTATTPSGQPRDRFHFTYATEQWEALTELGVEAGYGAQFIVISARPPRQVLVAYTQPNSPATTPPANLARGAEVLAVDGVDLVNANDQASVDIINAGLFPTATGVSHTFSILDLGETTARTVTMVSADVKLTPVQHVETIDAAAGTVGYLHFSDHITTAELLLVNAFGELAQAKVSDLVLDLRYNGGGLVEIASEVAYMIAGPGATTGRTFDRQVFNDRYPDTNPFTGQSARSIPFYARAVGFSAPQGLELPTLNLSRVAVLTSANTCSASEAILNSLRGVGIEVIEVGATTCGKPYGFYPRDNCGTTYFSIQFQGVNDLGFGDYPDGFSPENTPGPVGILLPGCSVADDFTHALGDRNEGRLAAALDYLAGRGCPESGTAPAVPSLARISATDGRLIRSPLRENRIGR